MRYLLKFVALCLVVGTAQAVPYTIPGSGTNWHTLEYDGLPYGVVDGCEGQPGTQCDVPAGTYKLVNQVTGIIIKGVVIGGTSSGSNVSFVSNSCSGGYVGTTMPDTSLAPTSCNVACPVGLLAIGIAQCNARISRAGMDPALPTIWSVDETGVGCRLANVLSAFDILENSGAADLEITSGVVCMEP